MSSFQQALDAAKSNNTADTLLATASTMSLKRSAPVTLDDGEEFVVSDKYTWYDTYHDEDFSYIDESKNINVSTNQINITQEQNSQVIPFELNRYYDGVDLMDMSLAVYFVNAEGNEGRSVPINVTYSSEKIRFYWLVGNAETAIKGNVAFEIHALGKVEGKTYVWKTKPNRNGINILESLVGNGKIEPSDEWYTTFIETVDEKIAEAQVIVNDAREYIDGVAADVNKALEDIDDAVAEAKSAVSDAEAAVNDAEAAVSNAQEVFEQFNADFESAKSEIVEEITAGVISEIDELTELTFDKDSKTLTAKSGETDIASVELDIDGVTDLAFDKASNTLTAKNEDKDIASVVLDIDGLANLSLSYDVDSKTLTASNGTTDVASTVLDINGLTALVFDKQTKTLEAKNGENTIASAVLDIDPSEDWANEVIGGKITEALSEINATVSANSASISSVSATISSIDSSVKTAESSVAAISAKVAELESELNGVDKSQRLTYDVKYNDIEDAEVGENVFAFYEITNEGQENETREIKQKFTIVGGGGATTSSSLYLRYITPTPFVITPSDKAIIYYNFSGTDSSGDAVLEGVATWKVAGNTVATQTIKSGDNHFDITEHINLGTQKVTLSVIDDAGSLVTKSWTVQKVDVRIESSFSDRSIYPVGSIDFNYTPYGGGVTKTVHFLIDGEEIDTVETTSSGLPLTYPLPAQAHGSHLVEVYMTFDIYGTGDIQESNRITKDIIWYDSKSDNPIIGCALQNFNARQYDTTNIYYTVYDPKTTNPNIILAVDGKVVSTPALTDGNTGIWNYKSSEPGEHILTITCGETIKTLKANIEKLSMDIEPVTTGLAFDFNPVGYSNNDINKLWSYGDVSMSVSENFDWINGGYQIDENGDQYFCIKAGTTAEIDYQMFADDAKKNGKEFKLIFKTTNVSRPDAMFLSCIDNTTESDHVGIQMGVHEAYIYGQAGKLHLPYSEEDIIEFEFNISKDTEPIPMVMGYEDGVSTCPMVYDATYGFTQVNPKTISIGSEFCDLHIYRLKVYNMSLTDRNILNNFILDARNSDEMIARYDRNQIYNENQQLDPDVLAEKCPWLRIIKIEAPRFTTGKSDKVSKTKIQYIYKDGDAVLDNWVAYDCLHSGQGTTSDDYGAAGRNLDLIMNVDGARIVLGDGTEVDKVSLTRNSVPVNYFNIKVNIASSENANNALLQQRYNQFNPYKRPFVRDEGYDTSIIKDTMEFHNCVVFIRETDANFAEHKEFADDSYHFYAIGNIGDSKKTDKTRLTDPNDKYECINEIIDVDLPLSDFPGDANAIAILESENFDKKGTYEWRYIWKEGTDEQNAEVAEYCKQRWVEFYKFVVNSSDEEFRARLGEYFVIDSALYYYLFTTRYTMVDNRAKNSFWHYGKTGEVSENGEPIRKWDLAFDYDNDTALGINNYGDMVYRYGLEDTDVDDAGTEVFRESDSTFFCRIRDLFQDELRTMYNTLESQNAWRGEGLISQFDRWQSEFPEELWRTDTERKYIRTYNSSYIAGEGDSQFLVNMAKGRKKYQRRQFERNQEKYMASKYQSSVAKSDSAIFRCSVPTGDLVVEPNYKLKLTPYSHMYLNVQYGNTDKPIQLRAEPNIEYEMPFDGSGADVITVYSSSLIQNFGDLSPCYPATANTSQASKIKKLILGNETEGYDNSAFTTLTTGANRLLEELNIENISGLDDSLDLSALNNLKQLYAYGSNITGVTFANGGRIETVELPAITKINMKNLSYLKSLDISDYSKLIAIEIENCDSDIALNIVNNAPNINQARITGIDWNLEDASILDRLYKMRGFDQDGHNTERAVLTGKVHVPVVRERQLYNYRNAWSDLEISSDSIIKQHPVTFKNEDGTILEIQYVDMGGDATDPINRGETSIPIPTKNSTVSHDYTFVGWDVGLNNILGDRVVTAVYSESLRKYTVKYVSHGEVLQEIDGYFGENILYNGDIPSYTIEEEAYKYQIFNRWDKSGIIEGDKTINAIFDTFEYTDGYFEGKELADLKPVELYALTKLGMVDSVVQDADTMSITMGKDYEFDDVDSEVIISSKTEFTGENYIDTGICLFDEDKDFVLAIDYEFTSTATSVLAQCYRTNGYKGFQLEYSSGIAETWGTNMTKSIADVNNREMIIIRHKKGENKIWFYNSQLYPYRMSNLDYAVQCVELDVAQSTIFDKSLVLGCAKSDDGVYESHAKGNIYWCKLWYADLGDEACKKLATWTHEEVEFAASGSRRYTLSKDKSQKTSLTLLATHLLERARRIDSRSDSTITGGWGDTELKRVLNTRLYEAMPDSWKALVKSTIVPSYVPRKPKVVNPDNPEEEITIEANPENPEETGKIWSTSCYITIPAVAEIYSGYQNTDPYMYEIDRNRGAISYMGTATARKRGFDDKPDKGESYWTRSFYASSIGRLMYVDSSGNVSNSTSPTYTYGILIEISI